MSSWPSEGKKRTNSSIRATAPSSPPSSSSSSSSSSHSTSRAPVAPPSLAASSIAGITAGAVASIVTCPLDVVKTRVQAGGHTRYRGTVSSLRTIFAEEGVRGFYHGLWPTMVGFTFNWAVYFACYSRFKVALAKLNSSLREGSPLNHMTSAVAAGAVTATVTSPFWVVKTRYQTHSAPKPIHGELYVRYGGVLSSMYNIAKREGPSALYKGLGVSMFGLVHVAIQFPLYENFKVQLADGDGHLSLSGLVVATATSKAVAGAISYPHEVIRSRQQHSTKPLRAIDAAHAVYRHSGWQGFYHGLGTNLLRVMPSCVITFVTYEFVASLLTDLLEGSKLA